MKFVSRFKSFIKKYLFFSLKILCEIWIKPTTIDRVYIFVTEEQSVWILGAIAREIKDSMKFEVVIGNNISEIRNNDLILFMHYETAGYYLLRNFNRLRNPYLIWFTHPRRSCDLRDVFFKALFDKSFEVLASCSKYSKKINDSVGRKVAKFVPYGVDKELFYFSPAQKSDRLKVGISSNYYLRKNPTLLEKFIKNYPNIDFVFAGKGWTENTDWIKYDNYYNVKPTYQEYPAFYKSIQVLVNCSELEGGPIGVVECLSCGVPVFSSQVGLVEDVVQEGINGNMFDLNDDMSEVFSLFEETLQINSSNSISESVTEYTWCNLAKEITILTEKYNASIYTH